jgi:hypothetical protein
VIRHQLVQWILLPNGLTAEGRLAASVFVAPRLHPSEPTMLEDFPDFADWRSVLGGLQLIIERADGVTEAPLSVSISSSAGLWKALFPPATTAVRAFAFDDLADRPLISYPVHEVLGHLRERWASLASSAPDELPITSRNASPIGPPLGPDERSFTLVDHFRELREAGVQGIFAGVTSGEELSARLRRELDAAAAQARALRLLDDTQPHELIRPFGGGGSPPKAFYALAGFHARPSREQPKDFPADAEQARAELENALDFHHHLSLLGDHPAVLRALGLVFDLEIRADFVPTTNDTDPATPLRLRLERPSAYPPRSDDPGAESWNADVTPWTSSRLTVIDGQAFFSAAERSARLDFAHGFLHVDPARYAPVAVDIDGLALKVLNMAATLQRQEEQEQRPVEEPARAGVPSIRTGGVALVHSGHADTLHADFQQARVNDRALEKDPDNPPTLAAEDLVRGYRLDIWSDGRWRSLHERHIAYTPDRDPAERLEADDEGSIQLSLTAEVDRPAAPADPDRPLYAHEAMATWDGWSLSLPRPGDPISHAPAVPEPGAETGSMRLVIAASSLPGCLPRLRFQSLYRMRVRTMDLAGNSLTLPTADRLLEVLEATGQPRYVSAAPSNPMPYLRFELVPPPELVPRHPFGPGESLERLVIRSIPGQSVEEYARASQGAGEPFLRFRAFCDRHVAAAKASLQLVETHGLLDDAIDAVRGLEPAAAAQAAQPFYELASRESGSFRDAPGALFVSTGTHDRVPQGYVCIDADTVELPYLPDPLAAGARARLTLRPGRPDELLEIRFGDGGGWHRPLPFRLRLEEGNFTAKYDRDARLLTVGLSAGRTARLRLSSLFRTDPEIFGILDWCRQELDSASAERVEKAIKSGTHWMTTPWRDLVLVHAVQRPLEPARLELDLPDVPGFAGTPSLARPRGATAADLSGRFFFDQPSTAELNLSATWDEVEDEPGQTYRVEDDMLLPVSRDVFSLPVPEPFGTPWIPEVAPFIEAIDDKGVSFRTRGPETETPEQRRLKLLGAPGLTAPERRRLEAGGAQLEKLRGHEFSDTKYRRVTYQPTAATRFREYFDPNMPATDGTSPGEPLTVAVLSSAPPAKPQVLQILPLMRYAQERRDGATTSSREGVGLRVWLERPWWSSGAGELLAVVCERGGPLSPDSELSREITVIVQDPAHASTIPQPLMAQSFSASAFRIREAVPLHRSEQVRDIAAFRPVWDRGRQAWYCDIEFPTGAAYFPFVRLGLARYQPFSIPGCELSPIVPTAFVQTVPNRTVTCALEPGGAASLSVSGPAPSASMDARGTIVAGTNVMAAVVEAQEPAIADSLLGWAAAGPEIEFTAVLNGDGTATWSGAVQVPEAQGRKLRLVVREYETHPADDRSTQPSPGLVTSRRLVSADVIPL